jgi:hypothetical protein
MPDVMPGSQARMIEISFIAFMALSGILFALGGTVSTDIRRVWLPVCTFVFLLASGVPWWRALAACVFQWWIFSQGYGERFSWAHRALVAGGFAVPAVIALKPTVWTLLTPAGFLGMFVLSNSPTVAGQVPWKLVEFGTGVLVSFTFIGALGKS